MEVEELAFPKDSERALSELVAGEWLDLHNRQQQPTAYSA
jgi:hypothetical protein